MRVDHDHELQVHDIIKLPHEVRVDHDHESQIHDIIRQIFVGKAGESL